MVSVNVEELLAYLDRYLEHMNGGEEVVITDHGRAVARLVPYDRQPSTAAEDETFGETRYLRRAQRQLPPGFWGQPEVVDPKSLFRRAVLEEREQNW